MPQDKKQAAPADEGVLGWLARKLSGETPEQAAARKKKEEEDAKRLRESVSKAVEGYKTLRDHPAFGGKPKKQ